MTHRLRYQLMLPIALMCASASIAQDAHDATELSAQDARLNRVYRQRVAQLRSDPAALAALRSQERDWIQQRDRQCGKDAACLAQSTKARADSIQAQVGQNDANAKTGSSIPQELLGKWVVRKQLPLGKGVFCWDQKQADSLIGTEIEYRADSFQWKGKTIRSLGSKTGILKAQEFAQNGPGDAPPMTFHDLGIAASEARQIQIDHPDAAVFDKSMDCCAEIPGETVLMKGPDTLIFGACGIYYEAARAGSSGL